MKILKLEEPKRSNNWENWEYLTEDYSYIPQRYFRYKNGKGGTYDTYFFKTGIVMKNYENKKILMLSYEEFEDLRIRLNQIRILGSEGLGKLKLKGVI